MRGEAPTSVPKECTWYLGSGVLIEGKNTVACHLMGTTKRGEKVHVTQRKGYAAKASKEEDGGAQSSVKDWPARRLGCSAWPY